MRPPTSTPLQEAPGAAPAGAKVIDVEFNVVGEPRRPGAAPKPSPKPKPALGFFAQIKRALVLAGVVVLVGLLVPPTVVLVTLLLRELG